MLFFQGRRPKKVHRNFFSYFLNAKWILEEHKTFCHAFSTLETLVVTLIYNLADDLLFIFQAGFCCPLIFAWMFANCCKKISDVVIVVIFPRTVRYLWCGLINLSNSSDLKDTWNENENEISSFHNKKFLKMYAWENHWEHFSKSLSTCKWAVSGGTLWPKKNFHDQKFMPEKKEKLHLNMIFTPSN